MRQDGQKLILNVIGPISLRVRRLRALQEHCSFFIRLLAFSDIAYVALNNLLVAFHVDVADELHLSDLPPFGFERQVFVAEIAFRLQLSKCILARLLSTEQTDFPKLLAQKFVA